ncbi:MAG TPA: hypothetical protein VGI43_17395 [Mucilaginibacter sp.]
MSAIKQNALLFLEEGAHLVFYIFTPYDYLPPRLIPVVVNVVDVVL